MHSAIWLLGDIKEQNIARRRVLRRRIFEMLNSDRYIDEFLKRMYAKFREGKGQFEVDDGFYEFILDFIASKPKEVLEMFVRILNQLS